MEIRDTRNGDWHWVYNAVLADPHINPSDKLVYGAISTFGGHQVIHPTIVQIAERCDLSERAVQESIKKLEEVGYLSLDKSTGRGNANVYYLLKSPKGCKFCTFSKECKIEQERVQTTTVKGAEFAPHIDNIYKKDISADAQIEEVSEKEEKPKSSPKYPNARTLFKEVFGAKYPMAWNTNPAQLQAAENLFAEHGIEEARDAYRWYQKNRPRDFAWAINTPWDLDNKWQKLDAYFDKVNS